MPSRVELALGFQRNELTGHLLYNALAERSSGKNKAIFSKISAIELSHYNYWKKLTGKSLKPLGWQIFHHLLFARVFGMVFAAKLLEREEIQNQRKYLKALNAGKAFEKKIAREEALELSLIRQVAEERLEYADAIMLGMGDAVVEFTGTLAGLAFALQNTALIALAGVIGGISASMSMASSEYLSKRSAKEKTGSPLKAALYTGMVYFIIVLLLVLPNFLFKDAISALSLTVAVAFLVVLAFTYFISITQEISFRKRLAETLSVCFGIALIAFMIGTALKALLGVSA